MAELPEESLDALARVLQQFCGIAQLDTQDLDDAANREMVHVVITSIRDFKTQAGVDSLSLERQQQEDARQQEAALQADVIRQVLGAPRTPRRGCSSSTESQYPAGHKRPRLSIRLQDRPRSVAISPSSSRERNSTLEQKLEGLYLAEHIIDELRKEAESEPLTRGTSIAAPVPPRRLKEGGKQS
jgi:hypothetical protein